MEREREREMVMIMKLGRFHLFFLYQPFDGMALEFEFFCYTSFHHLHFQRILKSVKQNRPGILTIFKASVKRDFIRRCPQRTHATLDGNSEESTYWRKMESVVKNVAEFSTAHGHQILNGNRNGTAPWLKFT